MRRPNLPPLPRQAIYTARSPARRDRRLGKGAFVVWLLLLILPGLAIHRLSASVDTLLILGVLLVTSVVTWRLYRSDKNNAQAGLWRTPESALHLAELAGGWIAAFLAQRIIRHKISKTSYQTIFWGIILLHQYAAFDCLKDWQFSRGLYQFVASRF